MQVFVIVNNNGIKINADVNVNNQLEKDASDKRFIWNLSNCICECDKLCDVGEYLDYENCKGRKKNVDKFVEECNENTDGNEMIYNGTLNEIEYNSIFTVYIVLFVIAFLIIRGICSAYFYFHWHLKRDNNYVNTYVNTGVTEAVIY